MSEQEKPSLDDADGNCKQCGHRFNPHMVLAHDTNRGMQLFPQPRLSREPRKFRDSKTVRGIRLLMMIEAHNPQ
jgi:hypothetical protein